MDDEDLADAAEAQKVETSEAFAGLGSETASRTEKRGLTWLLRSEDDAMGHKLLRKMGWKDGQGIGPKVRRSARLEITRRDCDSSEVMHIFAPDDVPMVKFLRKTDRKGLGYEVGGDSLYHDGMNNRNEADPEDDNFLMRQAALSYVHDSDLKTKRTQKGGIGIGILNDNGSDDDDPYEMGPRIKYNRILGDDKKKKKAKKNVAATSNPSLKGAPVFLPKTARAGMSIRRCHDGRLPLDGFTLGKITEDFSSLLNHYTAPEVPLNWKSSKDIIASSENKAYVSSADAAKESQLDARSRAIILGEKPLPGKSVFDYISASSRNKLAIVLGKETLPPGLGQVPEGFALSDEERLAAFWSKVPKLDQTTASAALSRGAGGPYIDNDAKRDRYRAYLEQQAKTDQPRPPKPKGMSDEDLLKEMHEFYNCARIFKPMTGFMASRFTTAKSTHLSKTDADDAEPISTSEPKTTDPVEQAAKMGMYGHMTRSVQDFFPSRLLCKRFNVKAPAHSMPDPESEGNNAAPSQLHHHHHRKDDQLLEDETAISFAPPLKPVEIKPEPVQASTGEVEVVRDRNEAVEGLTAHEDVLWAIFGDSDSE